MHSFDSVGSARRRGLVLASVALGATLLIAAPAAVGAQATGPAAPKAYIGLFKDNAVAINAAVCGAREALCSLIDAYDAPDRSYLSQPQPGLAPRYSDYAQLARVSEWAAVGEEE